MKRPAGTRTDADREAALMRLSEAFAVLRGSDLVAALLRDLCTPAELEAMSDRWQVVPLLLEGVPYRDIHERTGVSVTTIGRVARSLTGGAGGYRAAIQALHRHRRSASAA
jgi:TrpR-related protein YerC/YecD